MEAKRCSICGDFILDSDEITTCTYCMLEEVTETIWYIVSNRNKIFTYATSYEKAIENFSPLNRTIKSLRTVDFISKVREQRRQNNG